MTTEIFLKCPHCNSFYRNQKELEACKSNNFDLLFKSEEVVIINLPRIPKLHNTIGIVRAVDGPVLDQRTEERKENNVYAFVVEIYSVTCKEIIHLFFDQLIKKGENNEEDDGPEIEID